MMSCLYIFQLCNCLHRLQIICSHQQTGLQSVRVHNKITIIVEEVQSIPIIFEHPSIKKLISYYTKTLANQKCPLFLIVRFFCQCWKLEHFWSSSFLKKPWVAAPAMENCLNYNIWLDYKYFSLSYCLGTNRILIFWYIMSNTLFEACCSCSG